MSLFDDHPLTELDQKAHAVLGDKVVVKSLAATAAFARLPRYVSEYLIAKYVKPESWRTDLANRALEKAIVGLFSERSLTPGASRQPPNAAPEHRAEVGVAERRVIVAGLQAEDA